MKSFDEFYTEQEQVEEGLKEFIAILKTPNEMKVISNIKKMIDTLSLQGAIKIAMDLNRRDIDKIRNAMKHQEKIIIEDPELKEFAIKIGAI